MKFTLDWLKQYLDTDAGIDRIAEALTTIGLEVEEVTDRARELAPFKVVHVKSAEPHPDADKLKVCEVDTGAETVQVVCGAPNAHTGMKAVFAASGTVVPGTKLKLKKSKIRGVESNGMLVSERELGLSDEHTGIIEAPADAPVGTPFAEVAGLDDPIIEIAITPNRGDCLGVYGIARDLAAAGLGRLKPLPEVTVPGQFESPVKVHLAFPKAAENACPLFAGRLIRGVKNGSSPKWLQDRLTAIGLRPISVLVDITNFFTFDLGRPLHVFDAGKLAGDLTVRFARPGETLKALDERAYALADGMTVIADEKGPQGLGGIMGGEETGVTGETTDVFLEAAYFDPKRTAETGRKLQIESDARYRFERTVDPAFVLPATELATQMILDLCGGEASETVVAGAEPAWRHTVTFRPARVASLGGVAVEAERARAILVALGFAVESQEGDSWRVAVPSWRPDIDGEADIVEEVLRIVGYDNIPAEPLSKTVAVTQSALTPTRRRQGWARRALAGRGMTEAVTWSFLPQAQAEMFGGGAPELRLLNPISTDLSNMRPSLLANLATAAARALDRGFADTALFEVGPTYENATPAGQRLVAGGVRRGKTGDRNWLENPRAVDAFDAKADALAALAAIGAAVDKAQVTADAPDYYHPGRSGTIRLGPKLVLGHFGELHPAVLEALDLKGPVAAFEVFLDAVPVPKRKAGKTRSALKVSDFQAVDRDFAFIVDRDVRAEDVLRTAKGADKALIVDATVFDLYEGKGIEEGKKSLAFSVRLQAKDRTLTDEEINAVADKVVQAVTKVTGGALRA